MLSSALICCFTVWLNDELCFYWLFHCAAYFSSSHFCCFPRLFLHNTCRTSDDLAGLEHGRVYANVGGITISDLLFSDWPIFLFFMRFT